MLLGQLMEGLQWFFHSEPQVFHQDQPETNTIKFELNSDKVITRVQKTPFTLR